MKFKEYLTEGKKSFEDVWSNLVDIGMPEVTSSESTTIANIHGIIEDTGNAKKNEQNFYKEVEGAMKKAKIKEYDFFDFDAEEFQEGYIGCTAKVKYVKYVK